MSCSYHMTILCHFGIISCTSDIVPVANFPFSHATAKSAWDPHWKPLNIIPSMKRKIPSSQTHAQEQLHNDNIANYFLNILCLHQGSTISKFQKKKPVGMDEHKGGQKWNNSFSNPQYSGCFYHHHRWDTSNTGRSRKICANQSTLAPTALSDNFHGPFHDII